MKIATISTNIPDRRGHVVLNISESEPEVSAIGGEAYLTGITGEGNQSANVAAVRICQINLRAFRKGELATIRRPRSPTLRRPRIAAGNYVSEAAGGSTR